MNYYIHTSSYSWNKIIVCLFQLVFLTKAKIRHFWGTACLPSWKILDNSNNVKSDF
jgi:hypothetical protein